MNLPAITFNPDTSDVNKWLNIVEHAYVKVTTVGGNVAEGIATVAERDTLELIDEYEDITVLRTPVGRITAIEVQ